MEIRDFADRILKSDTLAAKLERHDGEWTDIDPGPPERMVEPIRPANLQFALPRTAPAMPSPQTFKDPARRALAHHIMANHELQALEVMAFVLRAFPDAPQEFRRGLVDVMADEQRHTRMHMERGRAMGLEFGERPVNCYIWKKAQDYESVLDYLAGLPLTFEGRNLDHTLEFECYFDSSDDPKSAAIMAAIHRDEIEHVAFGLEWLRKLKPEELSDWDTYCKHLRWPIKPAKSVGDEFHSEPRRAAGMTEEFISELQKLSEGVDDA